MNRRVWILTWMRLIASRSTQPRPLAFPQDTPGGWHLKSSKILPVDNAPELVHKIGARSYWTATYEGPGSAAVDVYELTSSLGGLELVQRWRPLANTVVFYTPRYFVVVKWQSEDRGRIQALVRTLESELNK